MAAEKSTVCLVAVMDRLWFHQIILFAETPSFRAAEDVKTLIHSSKFTSQMQEISPLDEISSEESDDFEKETDDEIPTRLNLNLNLVSGKGRCQSSSPISAQKRWRNHPSLKKSVSCKRLVDLELEEVKGFMDLGFIFRRENLTKRIIHLVPGLQRIGWSEHHSGNEIIRPYLSEAWAVRSPNSPLLNLRIPAASTAADMKKHLKYWAHTVASAIHQH
ncbi:uncharacterized protein LOC130997701 [Salvia miltiorrhiza]|uniref:uncharacterized protein LOC130997701 n=1 Tax=Salvia miltiorrhiza TaxID=226208 RepID=UPI0025AC6C12|nr:uncharacterized protein LOC130997701 [Salvia miltiorrhiza]